ncbi:LysR family transcriptional regulator [Nonomuraea sp. NPDC050394]|uniref:LysR family transcriptional regulator n=1 Tax=Nonomuraea sp. NPDC050394 TaxID=3364363 RepID=UPI0037B0F270
MDLLPLRYFQAVARHEHISRAAEELRVAQPSLSRTIARLEADLGVPLFDRQGRRVRLNRFGAAFLRRVDRALGELEDGRRELADAAGLTRGSVSVASETLIMLVEPVKSFIAAHPGVGVRLLQSDTDTMAQRLREGEVDLCLTSQPLEGAGFGERVFPAEQVLLAVSPSHRLAGRTHATMADLRGERVATTPPGHWQRTMIERLFAAAGMEPVYACEANEAYAVVELVSAGLAIGFVPAWSAANPAGPPIVLLRLDAPGCERVQRLIWRERAYLSAAARQFREHLLAALLPGG